MTPSPPPDSPLSLPRTLRVTRVDDIRPVTARAASLAGRYELDLAAYHFLADSAPDLDHIGHWVPHALGQLLDEMRCWPGDPAPQAGASTAAPPAEQRALIGSLLALEALVAADTADPAVARARLDPPRRRVARDAARLAMAPDGEAAREAWNALLDLLPDDDAGGSAGRR
ncbi:MAG: hypothetical protein KDC33_01065 [Thermoleophilia bacterium]|nr:hypothetical protein [Thermoleophilia bacterium]